MNTLSNFDIQTFAVKIIAGSREVLHIMAYNLAQTHPSFQRKTVENSLVSWYVLHQVDIFDLFPFVKSLTLSSLIGQNLNCFENRLDSSVSNIYFWRF